MISTGGTSTLGLYDFKSALDDFGRIDYWKVKPNGYQLYERAILTNGDEVKSIIVGNINDPNTNLTGWVKTNSASQIFDSDGESQQELNNKLKKLYVTPYDFGYANGLDYGYYLQLAINSGKWVKGSYKNETVRAQTSVKISTSGQEIDLSMIEVELDNIAGNSDRTIGFMNAEPNIIAPLNWIQSSGTLPIEGQNSFTLVDASSINVGDYILISVTHAAENGISRPAFVTAKSGNTIFTSYIFGITPATLRVSRVNLLLAPKIKMPIRLIDLSTDTTDVTKMIGGLVARYVVLGNFEGSELQNGANPAYSASYCLGCRDFNFKTTNPRVYGSGQGYVNQINYSSDMESYNPTGYRARHVIDYTGSCYSKCYNATDPFPRHTPINTHGAYEHDIQFINDNIGDCSGVTGQYAVYLAGADAYFGNVSIRCDIVGGRHGGGFNQAPKCVSCNILDKAQFKTTAFSQCSPNGGISIQADHGAAGIIFTSNAGVGDISIENTKMGNIVLQENCGNVTVRKTSANDIRTNGTTKPISMSVLDNSSLSPSLPSNTNNLTFAEWFKISDSEVNGTTANAGYYFIAKSVNVESSVNIKNSVPFNGAVSEYMQFSGKYIDVYAGTDRSTNQPLVYNQSQTGKLFITNSQIKCGGTNITVPFRFASTSQAYVSKELIVTGSYIEGVTEIPNHVSLGKIGTMVLSANIFKDDSAILAIAETAKIKIVGNVKL